MEDIDDELANGDSSKKKKKRWGFLLYVCEYHDTRGAALFFFF